MTDHKKKDKNRNSHLNKVQVSLIPFAHSSRARSQVLNEQKYSGTYFKLILYYCVLSHCSAVIG